MNSKDASPDYRTIDDLPRGLRESFPDEVQRYFVAAYRRIREREVAGGGEDEAELHARAHRGALQAVEDRFSRDEQGRWRHDPIDTDMEGLGRAAEPRGRIPAERQRHRRRRQLDDDEEH